MDSALKIVIVDESPIRAAILEEGLREAGFTQVVRIDEMHNLLARIYAIDPDVILIDLENPSRDVLEQMFQVSRVVKRPIAMFVDQSDTASIQASVDAGVSAYIVDGLKKERIKHILDLCISRFNAFAKLQDELDRTKSALEERKVIDRAKGILMKAKKLTEEEAYALLRTHRDEREEEDRRDRAVGDHRRGDVQMSAQHAADRLHPAGRRGGADRRGRQGLCRRRRPRRRAGARGVVVECARQAQYRPVRRRASAGAGGDRLEPRARPRQGADRRRRSISASTATPSRCRRRCYAAIAAAADGDHRSIRW